MTAGFPEGTPLRRAVELHVQPLRPRPVPAHDVQGRAAGGDRARACWPGWARAQRAEARVAGRRAACSPLVASWPLIRGRAVDDQLLWERDPGGVAATRPTTSTRRGGRARRPARPALRVLRLGRARSTRSCRCWPTRPWRRATPSATPTCARPTCCGPSTRSSSSGARCPGQLDPLLDLLGARTVVAGADDDRTRSGAAPAAEAADVLDQLGAPDARLGRASQPRPRAAGTLGAPRALPQVRAWDRPDAPGLVRVEPDRAATSSSTARPRGSPRSRPFGAPRANARLRGRPRRPAQIRRARRDRDHRLQPAPRPRPSRLAQNAGPVLAADEEPSVDAALLNPFPPRRDAQTVAVYDGIAARARAVLARLPAVPRAPAVRGARRRRARRTGRPTAR